MNTAENDVPTIATGGSHLAELIAVAAQIAVGNDFVLLVMVPQQQQLVAGLSALLVASATAFALLKLAGVAYLVYLGLRALLRRMPANGGGKRVTASNVLSHGSD